MNLSVTAEICEACMLGKRTKIIPKTNTTKVKYPLELLQADFRVLRLRTDNGTEFCNNQLNQFLRSKGIYHELTESYASYQNGVDERMHRTLIERTRFLLSSSGCSERFWPYALFMANFLINREPSAAISLKIPYQLWYNKLPDYSRYHPFGCRAYYMIPNVRRQSKFSDIASLAVFLGHSESRKSYILYDCVHKSFIETSQVKFNAWDFPLKGSKKSSIPILDTIPGRPLTMRPQFYTHVPSSSEPQDTSSPSVQMGPLDSHMPDSIITPLVRVLILIIHLWSLILPIPLSWI
ncbi:hypothetical protein KL937_004663 [Ogataea polymorpha]|nr:hypothetical protein KL937_004663 [Ogataea polymorpha]KAG7932066.1 hypothetical protein KL904_004491 [Ogataea polymorpha]